MVTMNVNFHWDGDKATAAMRDAAARGLTKAANRVQAVTIPRTPMDTGDLRSSITVAPATREDMVATVSTELPYAAKQHEDLTLRHKHGQAKFLESALNDTRAEVDAIIAAEVRKVLGT